jgi:hypothetical protein
MTVRGDLPPELANRWEAAARSIGQNPARYDHWRPWLAALLLASDGARYHHLVGPLAKVVAEINKARRIKIRPLANYDASVLIRDMATAPPEVGTACVALAAEMVERLPMDGPRRATAWATGDLKAMKALGGDAGITACLDAAPAVAAFRSRAAADWAKELGHALESPGKTVVVVDLDDLTRKGGLLDQLKTQGLDVIGPEYR